MQDLLAKGIDEDGRVRSEETHEFCEMQKMRVPVGGWEVAQLKDVISEKLQSGYSGYETGESDGIRALTLTAVTENRIDVSNTKYIKADHERVKDLFIRRNDIFIERSNTLALVGLAALYEGDEPFAIYPDLLVRARANREMILPKILLESILHPRSRTYFRRSAKGTSGSMKKIDQKIIGNLYLPLPPPLPPRTAPHRYRPLHRRPRPRCRARPPRPPPDPQEGPDAGSPHRAEASFPQRHWWGRPAPPITKA